MLDRRGVLSLAALGAVGACSANSSGKDPGADKEKSGMKPERVTYGEAEAQYAELYRPTGTSRGVVVVIHGGFWRAQYDASLGQPLAESLAGEGWTAWNLEYRRVGNGGGVPETLDDVHAGIEALAEVDGLDSSTVVTLGHSAGGHLATWAAARGRFPQWESAQIAVTAVISQAGVLDLTQAYADNLGAGAIGDFVGGAPGPDYDSVDPARQLPLDVPLWCVHGKADDIVPLSQSVDYVAKAEAAGAQATMIEVEGDHFVVIDPKSDAWARTLEVLDGL